MKSQHPVDKWFRAMADKMPVEQDPLHWNELSSMLDEVALAGKKDNPPANDPLKPGGFAGSGGWFWIGASVLLLIIIPAAVLQWNLSGSRSEFSPSLHVLPSGAFTDTHQDANPTSVLKDEIIEDSSLFHKESDAPGSKTSTAAESATDQSLGSAIGTEAGNVNADNRDSLPRNAAFSSTGKVLSDSSALFPLRDTATAHPDTPEPTPIKRRHIFW